MPYEHMDQTFFINDEPSKALQNPKWSRLFFEQFKGHELSRNKVQWLNLASWLWLTLKDFPFAKMVHTHFAIIMQFSRPLFSS
jgi:hypothetical protein